MHAGWSGQLFRQTGCTQGHVGSASRLVWALVGAQAPRPWSKTADLGEGNAHTAARRAARAARSGTCFL